MQTRTTIHDLHGRIELGVAIVVGVALGGAACSAIVGPVPPGGLQNDGGEDAPLDAGDGDAPDEDVSDGGADQAVAPEAASDAPGATCDGTLTCDGTCTDLTANASHCGACGHACGGGECIKGLCQPVAIGGTVTQDAGIKSLYGIVLVDDYVVGTNWGKSAGILFRVSKNAVMSQPQMITPVPATSDSGGAGIARDDQYIYYTSPHNGTAYIANLDGSSVTPGNPPFYSAGGAIDATDVDAKYVYVRSDWGPQLIVIDKTTKQVTTVTVDPHQNFLADDGFVYVSSTSVLSRWPSGNPAAIAPFGTGGGKPDGDIRADHTFIYWFETSTRKLWRRPKDASAPPQDVTPTGGLPAPYADSTFIVDPGSDNLYFFSRQLSSAHQLGGTIIYRVSKSGNGTIDAIATRLKDGVTSLAQDDKAIYWGTYGSDDGTAPYAAVYKLVK